MIPRMDSKTAQAIIGRAIQDAFFTKQVYFNSYVELRYQIPIDKFKGFKVPQWTHITEVNIKDDKYEFVIGIFKTEMLYSLDVMSKYPFINFNP